MDSLAENLINVDRKIRRRLRWKFLFDYIKSNKSKSECCYIHEIDKLLAEPKYISKKTNCFSVGKVSKIGKIRYWKIKWRKNAKHIQSESFAPEILQKNDVETSIITFNGVECLVHNLMGKQNGKSEDKYAESRVKKYAIFPHKQIISNLNMTCPNMPYNQRNITVTLQNSNVTKAIKTNNENELLNNNSLQPKSLKKKGINDIANYLKDKMKITEDTSDLEKENKKSHHQINSYSILSKDKTSHISNHNKIRIDRKGTANFKSKNDVDKSMFPEIQCTNKPAIDSDLLIEFTNGGTKGNEDFTLEFKEDKNGKIVVRESKNFNKLLNNEISEKTKQSSLSSMELKKIDKNKNEPNESTDIFKIPTLNETRHTETTDKRKSKTTYNTKENLDTSHKNIQSHNKDVCVPNTKTKRMLDSILNDKSLMQMNDTSVFYNINCKMCLSENDSKYIYSYFKEIDAGIKYKQMLMVVNFVEQHNSNTRKYILGMRVLEELGKVDEETYKTLYANVKRSFSVLSKYMKKNLLDAYKNYVLWLYEHKKRR